MDTTLLMATVVATMVATGWTVIVPTIAMTGATLVMATITTTNVATGWTITVYHNNDRAFLSSHTYHQ
eukprot:3270875-Lingulodinium_polyedra.AAC.1